MTPAMMVPATPEPQAGQPPQQPEELPPPQRQPQIPSLQQPTNIQQFDQHTTAINTHTQPNTNTTC